MEQEFRRFLNHYLHVWRNSSLEEMKELISKDYQAREIRGDQIDDFGYGESIKGWEQGFKYVKEKEGIWDLKELAVIPLKEDEVMAVLSASIIIKGERLGTANLFFYTFKKDGEGSWKQARSYVETGISPERIGSLQLQQHI
jgi:hypothetical protein